MNQQIPTEGLLSDPQLLWDLNLQTLKRSELDLLKDRRFFSVENSGSYHGVGLWFTCTFPSAEEGEGAILLLNISRKCN